ncbi:NAD(P)-dependent oxidoreductase [Kitasatospora purpeofusca]|uniref:2-hydroxyacid dehydrogenase n=1 Tax=Kitasatospora purpeofusca TaxID=67352 RepID=A0ABZ1U8H4_9ACTN|nr:NAD(P)-dependent oxidoreductase [Kitasatospora purpeofusca]
MKNVAAGLGVAVLLTPFALILPLAIVTAKDASAACSASGSPQTVDAAAVEAAVKQILGGQVGPTTAVPGLDLPSVQIPMAKQIVATGVALQAPPRGQVIALATAMQDSRLRNLNGDRDSLGLFQQRPSQGMTIGVIGTGKIGECFARIAAEFRTRLLDWDINPHPARLNLGMTYTELPELLTRADLISLHVPLLPATHHLIDAAALARMKDDAILVNSSRGGLVDSAALVETLRAGRLSGVGLDVYEEETDIFFTDRSIQGITNDTLARLVTFPQVLVTSHQAYFTRTAVGQIIDTTARNIDDYAAGRTNENTLFPKP